MIFSFNSSLEISFMSTELRAAPFATKRWAFSGTIVSSGVSLRVSTKRFLSSDK